MKKFKSIKAKLSILLILAIVLQMAGQPFIDMASAAKGGQEQHEVVDGEEATDEDKTALEEENPQEDPEDTEAGEDKKEEEAKPEKKSGLDSLLGIRPMAKGGEISKNIFEFDYLKLGNEYIEDGKIIDIKDGTEVAIQFKWQTKDLDVKAGDWATMELPAIFKEANVQNQKLIVGGINVGTYSIVGRELKLEFNEEIEKVEVKNGYVGFSLEFNLEKFKENIEQEIKFNDSKNTTLNVIAKPTGEVSGIVKEGHPDNKHDAKEITWTIDVLNTDEETINNAIVKDKIPEGLKLQKDTFVVKELTVDYEGKKVEGDEVDIKPTTASDNDFEFKFSNMAPYKGYRIEYTTTIENYSKDSFTNDATLSYGGKDLPAKATVSGLTRSNPIEKDGRRTGKDEDGNDLIEWTIWVNKSGGQIDNAIVKDELPQGLVFVKGSMTVEKYVDNSKVDFNAEGLTNFPLKLGEKVGTIESNEYYKITFKTSVDWSEVNKGDYQKENTFTNKAQLQDDKQIKEAEKEVPVTRANILKKDGKSNVSYDDKTITWTVDVNEARHPLSNVKLTDTLPAGLDISKGDIVITNARTKETFTPKEIIITPDPQEKDKTTKIEIELGDIGTEHIKVKYKTTITDFTKDEFKNTASLEGDGIGKEGSKLVDKPLYPAKNDFGKSFSGINYNAKTMSWQLTVNPKREAISELKIVDTFPNKGLILLPDTLEVEIGGKPITEGYTLTPNTEDGKEGYQKGFTLELDESILPLNAQLVVTYKTSYDPQYVDKDNNKLDPHTEAEGQNKIYKNNARFIGKTINGNTFDPEIPVQTTVREDSWNSGKKEGQLVHLDNEGKLVNGWVSGAKRKIAWQLYTNYQEQDLGTGVVITDTLNYEGTIDKDSVKVSVYEVDEKGNTKIPDDSTVLKLGTDYVLDVDGKEFTLTFNKEVKERYVVEFTTSVPDISKENYINNATAKVGDKEYPYSGTVNYDKYNNFLGKKASLEGKDVYTGEEVEWEVKVNESLSILKDAKITDTISKGLVYVNDSLEVYKLEGDKEVPLKEDTDYTFKKSTSDAEETVLELDFTKDVDTALVLKYKTVVTETKGQVNNKVKLDYNGIEHVEIESEKFNVSQFSWAGGEFDPKKGALIITKVDAEEKDSEDNPVVIDNNEAKFTLEYKLNGERVQFGEVFTTKNGILEIGGLPLRTYYLREKESPTGYVLSEKEIKIEVKKAYNNNEDNIVKVQVENTKEKIKVTGTKVWVGGPETKPEIELQLYRDDVPYGDPVAYGDPVKLENGKTEYTWEGLDRTNKDGKEYKYTVDEVGVPEGYNKSISEDGLTVTNTRKTYAIGDYTWIDKNKDGIQGEDEEVLPGVKVELYYENSEPVLDKDGKPMITYTDENGLYIFDELEAGNYKIKFTLTEEQAEIYEFTKLTSEGDKAKTDSNANPVSGDRYGWTTIIELGDNSVTHDYENKEKNPYKATEGIDPTWDAGVILRERIEVKGSKTWDDANNQDGKRPESITIKLLADGKEIETKTVTAEDDWEWTFENLYKSKAGSDKDIVYTIVEETVKDYSSEIKGYNVTNSYTPGKTSVQVTKSWNDFNNRSGERPESITVKLLADEEDTEKTLTLTAENNWTATFTELDEYKAGKKIIYTVEEVKVDEYNTEITGDAKEGFVITNTRKTYAIGDYTWIDTNKDGIQDKDEPVLEGVIVELYDKDGELLDTTKTDKNGLYIFDELEAGEYYVRFILTEEQAEIYEFTKLTSEGDKAKTDSNANPVAGDRYGWTTIIELGDNSVTHDYENKEKNPYKATEGIDPTWDAGVILRERIEVKGSKTWDDANNQDGKRPESITIKLLKDGEELETKKVTAEDDWQWTFTNLYKSEAGSDEDIVYTIFEEAVKDYSSEIDGYDVTNSYTPGKTSVQVTKAWADADNQDGVRPEDVTIKLLANGKDTGKSVVLTENNNWTATFTELDEYKAGQKIDYTVAEEELENGYTSTITGNAQEGFVVTNSRTPEMINVEGSKTWNDKDNQDGVRPESITIKLLANGKEVDSKVVSEEDNWAWSFTNLPKYEAGNQITYTITEDVVEGYSSEINGYDVTNSYTPGKTSVQVIKAWNDFNNRRGNRPESITVKLLADGEDTERTLTLTTENNWTATFTELDEYKAGEKIVYTVEEVEIEGYKSSIKGDAASGFVITNTEEPKDPEKPNKPAKPSKPSKPSKPANQPSSPKTGVNGVMYLVVVVVVAGLALFFISKNKKK